MKPADSPAAFSGTNVKTYESRSRRLGEWPARVRALRVEIHPYFGYRADDCIGQLRALGYRAWLAPDPPDKWVFAVREPL